MPREIKKAVGEVRRCFRSVGLCRGDALLLACSGGRDSMALALASEICARSMGLFLSGIVVDHGLQEGSGEAAAQAAAKLSRMGIRAKIAKISLDPEEEKENGEEAAAREARYGAIRREAEDLGARAVLLAHTLTDQAESVLLDACKTPSSASWTGMAEECRREGVTYLRPFLRISRRETTAVCREAGVSWWDDPTNGIEGEAGKELPRRSRIRSLVLPELDEISGGGAEAHLAAFASMHREDEEFLDSLARKALEPFAFALPFSIPSSLLSSLPRPVERRCCRIILKSFLDRRAAVEKQVEAFMGLLEKGKGEICLASSLRLRVGKGEAVINLCNN
ncbi:MAG: tRNA lysidine(34) synthetase TilS [Aeriscardovia sp.]|nr:tRNA lysidine(34) synthetase TilS [Aeriscardovia sp.]